MAVLGPREVRMDWSRNCFFSTDAVGAIFSSDCRRGALLDHTCCVEIVLFTRACVVEGTPEKL